MTKTASPKIIVLDDDPTGSQTVHSCLLLLKWDIPTLVMGLQDKSPIFFVLTNTRSLTPEAAAAVTTEVCLNLKQALAQTGTTKYLLVSRSDSTLRGHYPVETDAIAQHLGPFDAHFLVPAFFEGGRVTVESTHYIEKTVDGQVKRIPTHETEFARDSVFGYGTSYLPDYVSEKTNGLIPAKEVVQFFLKDIRGGTLEQLMKLEGNQCVAIDGEQQSDLDAFSRDLLTAATKGKKFLFRSAAGLLTSLAALPPQPTPAEKMYEITRRLYHLNGLLNGRTAGAVIVGSHVKTTTSQLNQLLRLDSVTGVEVAIALLKENAQHHQRLLDDVMCQVTQIYAEGKTPVVYTSREELTFETKAARLAFGEAVSALMVEIVRSLPSDISFLISKGGITSNDTLSKALALTSARLLGQVIPGVSVVTTSANHGQFPSLPVVLFPGNVGDDHALALAYQRLAAANIPT